MATVEKGMDQRSGEHSGEQTPNGDAQSVATAPGTVKKRFQNGWTKELEDLMADWADKAACYNWMHKKTSSILSNRDRSIMFPVIILSTITGTANFALDGFFEPDSIYKKYAQSGIGGLSILAGILTTIGSKLAYSTNAEAHRVASISWGKFNRLICIEMNLNPDERMDAFNFLKMFRIELDRLIEQSPEIPESVIKQFNHVFKNTPEVVKPEIVGILNHTKVFRDTGARLKRIAAEATIALQYKKGVIKQLVEDSIERKTRSAAIDAARQTAQEILDREKALVKAVAEKKAATEAATAAKTAQPRTLVERQAAERKAELTKIASARAGAVNALREKFRRASIVTFQGVQPPPSDSPSIQSSSSVSSKGSKSTTNGLNIVTPKPIVAAPESVAIDIAPAVVAAPVEAAEADLRPVSTLEQEAAPEPVPDVPRENVIVRVSEESGTQSSFRTSPQQQDDVETGKPEA